VWKRGGGKVVLRVEASSVHGKGLFAGRALTEGQVLGRLWGTVVYAGPEPVAWARQRKSDRLVLLRVRGREKVVDVRGCPFEFMNHAGSDKRGCNCTITPGGVVSALRDVDRGEELCWDYDLNDFKLYAPHSIQFFQLYTNLSSSSPSMPSLCNTVVPPQQKHQ
jgi:hypothetical protein